MIIQARYELGRRASAWGGMGSVYRARDRRTGEPVAVKVLEPADDIALARFEREAALLARLDHPGIVRYVSHGVELGRPYLVMEWVDGDTLDLALAKTGLDIAESLVLGIAIADALGAAHAAGIVHRDVKPSNLIVGPPARLLDFGVARGGGAPAFTLTGAQVGTPGYMAPEQARGEPEISPAADVFALGCVLYECLTGDRAFAGDHLASVSAKVLLVEPPSVARLAPDVPLALSSLVARLIAKDPGRRPPDGSAVAAELAALPPPPRSARRRRATTPQAATRITEAPTALVSVVVVDAPPRDPNPGDLDALRAAALAVDPDARVVGLADGVLVVALVAETLMPHPDCAPRAAEVALALARAATDRPIAIATGQPAVSTDASLAGAIERGVATLAGGVLATMLASRSDDIRLDAATLALLVDYQVRADGAGGVLVGGKRT